MTVFTRIWDAAYEAIPSDTDNASEGAARIRNFKTDTQERGVVDHSWVGNSDDGKHKKVTFNFPLTVKPALLSDEAALYTKSINTKSELFFEDEDGGELQITSAGGLNVPASPIASGTVMCFFQASAPSLWTQVTSQNDKVLRVVSGSGGGDAGSWVISGITVDSHILDITEMPEHTHELHLISSGTGGGSGGNGVLDGNSVGNFAGKVDLIGGGDPGTIGQGHVHGFTSDASWRPAYIDVIICSKD